MKPNLNNIEAIMRITCGLTGLAWSTARLSRRCLSPFSIMIATMSAMKVAEGVTKFCPIKALYNETK